MRIEEKKAWITIFSIRLNDIIESLKKTYSDNNSVNIEKDKNNDNKYCIVVSYEGKTDVLYLQLEEDSLCLTLTHEDKTEAVLDNEYLSDAFLRKTQKSINYALSELEDSSLVVEDYECFNFSLTKLETSRAMRFINKHKNCCPHSTEGASGIEYCFMPTAIGTCSEVRCLNCGAKLNITDYNW